MSEYFEDHYGASFYIYDSDDDPDYEPHIGYSNESTECGTDCGTCIDDDCDITIETDSPDTEIVTMAT